MTASKIVNGRMVRVKTMGHAVDKKIENQWLAMDKLNTWLESLEGNQGYLMLSQTAHAYLAMIDSAAAAIRKRVRYLQDRDLELWDEELRRLGLSADDDKPAKTP